MSPLLNTPLASAPAAAPRQAPLEGIGRSELQSSSAASSASAFARTLQRATQAPPPAANAVGSRPGGPGGHGGAGVAARSGAMAEPGRARAPGPVETSPTAPRQQPADKVSTAPSVGNPTDTRKADKAAAQASADDEQRSAAASDTAAADAPDTIATSPAGATARAREAARAATADSRRAVGSVARDTGDGTRAAATDTAEAGDAVHAERDEPTSDAAGIDEQVALAAGLLPQAAPLTDIPPTSTAGLALAAAVEARTNAAAADATSGATGQPVPEPTSATRMLLALRGDEAAAAASADNSTPPVAASAGRSTGPLAARIDTGPVSGHTLPGGATAQRSEGAADPVAVVGDRVPTVNADIQHATVPTAAKTPAQAGASASAGTSAGTTEALTTTDETAARTADGDGSVPPTLAPSPGDTATPLPPLDGTGLPVASAAPAVIDGAAGPTAAPGHAAATALAGFMAVAPATSPTLSATNPTIVATGTRLGLSIDGSSGRGPVASDSRRGITGAGSAGPRADAARADGRGEAGIGRLAAAAEPEPGGPTRADLVAADSAPTARGNDNAPALTAAASRTDANSRVDTVPATELRTATPAAAANPASGARFADHLQALASVIPGASAATSSTAAPASPAAQVASSRLAVPLDSPQFAPALGAEVTLLARGGVQQARIELNPAEMGPISVQIVMDGNGARVDFQADVAATRQAIESSLPSLAGALRESGLTLTGGGVFQQSSQQQSGQQQHQAGHGRPGGQGRAGHEADDMLPHTSVTRATVRGLVDLVA